MKRKFPTLAVIVLVFAILWLLRDLNIIVISYPWLPITLIIIALGMIFNRLSSK